MWTIRRCAGISEEIGFDSENGEPLQISWNRSINNRLNAPISKSMGFVNRNQGFWRLVIWDEPYSEKNCDISWSSHINQTFQILCFLATTYASESIIAFWISFHYQIECLTGSNNQDFLATTISCIWMARCCLIGYLPQSSTQRKYRFLVVIETARAFTLVGVAG